MLRPLLLLLSAAAACATASQPETYGEADGGDKKPTTECKGRPDGAACGDASEYACDGADICFEGVCTPNHAPAGTPCGSPDVTDCSGADTCNGDGQCSANDKEAGSPCGDSTATACDLPDACDDDGECLPNHAAAGTGCGSDVVTDCSAADTCDGSGACDPRHLAEGGSCDDCADGPGECATCSTGVCENSCSDPVGLTTTFDNDNGLHGNMFDVVARENLRIVAIDANLPAQNSDDPAHNVLIYYRLGTHVGHEQTASDWTLLGGATVTANGVGAATPIPVSFEVPLAAGQRAAFYVTTMGTPMRYTYGTQAGDLYASDPNLDIYEGSGNASDFGNYFSPRVFNGRVHYRLCD